MALARPLIGVIADHKLIGKQPHHVMGEKYLRAVLEAGAAIPVMVPALAEELGLEELLGRLDGLLLTGSPSNVEPHHYAGPPSAPGTLHDPARDATTLPLIAQAIAGGVPVLGICRGFQEMNVAFGGTLHQQLHTVSGCLDHRDDESQPLEVQYGPAHEVRLEPDGLLRTLAGTDHLMVNSLHEQGIARLGEGLAVEARAPDGVIEAFRPARSASFAVGVQWHPEWQAMRNPFSHALFAAFGQAARGRMRVK